jgi:hypothetical protein
MKNNYLVCYIAVLDLEQVAGYYLVVIHIRS